LTINQRAIPITLTAIFMLAVLAPSIALGFLALRAAERESLYVERRLESALMAEVDLAAARIDQMMSEIRTTLAREAASLSGADGMPIARWGEIDPLVETPFTLRGGRIETTDGGGPGGANGLIAAFGAFLEGGARIPAYDLVTRIYRYEAPSGPAEKKSDAEGAGRPAEGVSRSKMGITAQAPPTKGYAADEPSGVARQMAQSRIASDTEARDELFERASREGFEILRRNVAARAPVAADKAPAPSPMKPAETRSRTVSRSRSFKELTSAGDNGLLPSLSDEGLGILFWARGGGGAFVGCTLRMEVLRDRIAGIMPDMLSDVRILTVLDDSGTPIVAPEPRPGAEPDWRRPFAAREISPELPRWEVGAWLVNQELLASRANFARMVVWVEVAALSLAIITGGVVIIRTMSYEMRVASQKTTFVANVSHELKTPLTSIRLFAELMASGKQGDEGRRREYLRTMMSEADRLSHLVDNVLTFSRRGREKYRMQNLSLAEVARDTLRQMEPHLVKTGFSVSFSEDGPLPARGDREALRQVIMNMLSNAEKYSGDVREISVRCASDGGYARAAVEDRGIGVDPGLSDRIFQEFYRADDSLSAMRGGAGLGLSIARGIARAHGGDVTYSPREGGGSAFTLSLPLRREGNDRRVPL
jgi:signal transduction histidine kinase